MTDVVSSRGGLRQNRCVTPRLISATVALSLALSGVAGAHNGVPGFKTRVTQITPPVKGIEISTLAGDDQIYLYNRTRTPITVLGYGGEPYLIIGPRGVEENQNSPAVYSNKDRYARLPIPKRASVTAKPAWKHLGDAPAIAWHDHRAHWMNPNQLPPAVAGDPTKPAHILDWKIPIRFGTHPVTLVGTLDYAPVGLAAKPTSSTSIFILLGATASAFLLATIALMAARGRAPK